MSNIDQKDLFSFRMKLIVILTIISETNNSCYINFSKNNQSKINSLIFI